MIKYLNGASQTVRHDKGGNTQSDNRCVGDLKPGSFKSAMIFKYIMILLPTIQE